MRIKNTKNTLFSLFMIMVLCVSVMPVLADNPQDNTVKLFVGGSAEVEGKVLTLESVGEDGSIKVEVDDESETIAPLATETVNGLRLTNIIGEEPVSKIGINLENEYLLRVGDKIKWDSGEELLLKDIKEAGSRMAGTYHDEMVISVNGVEKTLDSFGVEIDHDSTATLANLKITNLETFIRETKRKSIARLKILAADGSELENPVITHEDYEEEPACKDTDGGKNIYLKGKTVGLSADGILTTREDSCRAANYYGDGYEYVVEWFCWENPKDGKEYAINTNEKCLQGCENGACIGEEEPACKDTDGGRYYYERGTITTSNGVSKTDYCTDEPWGDHTANLIEYYCLDDGTRASYGYDCPNGCSNGACIKEDGEEQHKCVTTNSLRLRHVDIYTLGRNTYEVALREVTEDKSKARFTVWTNVPEGYSWASEGESTGLLREGESHMLSDGTKFMLNDIYQAEEIGEFTLPAAKFCFNGRAGKYCGDGVCDANENSEDCRQDCESPEEPEIQRRPNPPIDLSNYPNMMTGNGAFFGTIVVGDNAPSGDVIAAVDISTSIKFSQNEAGIIDVKPVKLASEIEYPLNMNLISVGRAKNNRISEKLLYYSRAAGQKITEGEALIALDNHNGYAQILVAGHSDSGTRKAAKVLANYKEYKLSGTCVVVYGDYDILKVRKCSAAGVIPKPEPEPEKPKPEPEKPKPEPAKLSDLVTKEKGKEDCEGEGCVVDDKCIYYQIRLVDEGTPSYCDFDGSLKPQREDDDACQNNFECLSNSCGNGVCQNFEKRLQSLEKGMKETQGVLAKILGWLGKLFG